MVSWILVMIVGVLIFSFFRWHYLKHKIITLFIILFILTFYFSVVKNVSEEANFASLNGVGKAVKTYFSWVGYTFKNIKALTGGATKIDWWTIENLTNATKVAKTTQTKPTK